MAVLFVMQLAAVGFAQARMVAAPPGAETVAASSAVALCHSDDDATAPSQNNKNGCAHCALCANGSRNDLPMVAPLLIFVLLSYDDAPASPPCWPEDAQRATPQGWTSSWSSRAPPTFS